MNLEQSEALIDLIWAENPQAVISDNALSWQTSGGTGFFVTTAWTNTAKTQYEAQVLYTLPPLVHLVLDKNLEKKLKKARKAIIEPRGFELIVQDGQTGLLLALLKKAGNDMDSLDKFKILQRDISILGFTTWKYFAETEMNKSL